MRSHRAEHARRTAAAFLLLVVAVLAGCGGDDEPAPGGPPSAIAPDSIDRADLVSCRDPKLPSGLRCGTIELPYERSDRSLGEIAISFAVRPRTDRDSPSQGAIVAVEGGPGYGSIGSAADYIATFGSLLRHRDLVLVDARGTGRSDPIDCPDMQSGRATDDIGVAACAEELGERYGSYRTAAAADDINDVRAALGYDRVQMYGDSYGTYLAQSYAFRHGDTLEALVLDSAYPVRGESGWYPSTWRTGIRGLTIACERSPECRGDAGRRLARFVRELRERRLSVGPLLDAISEAGFSPPDSYLRIDRAISMYLGGDESRYEEMTAEGHVGFGKPSGYSVGQELAISCNDYPMRWDKGASWEERRRQFGAAIAGYPKRAFAPFTPAEVALTPDYSYDECLGAPPPSPLYEPPAEPGAEGPDVPVFVIGGELDDVTSPAEAKAAAALFPDSELFIWPNAGHVYSLYDPSSRGAVRIREFLRENGG
ncbi:MAG: alpha/beta fold hydrolase [Solirubrobacterales bacterium]|nr:alpha/beta fold hydrolase [Solirubrobacterales bacterium]